MAISLTSPFDRQALRTLRAGDSLTVSGIIYTARDAAHARLCAALAAGEPLPVDLRGQTVFLCRADPYSAGQRRPARSAPRPACAWIPTLRSCCATGVSAIIGKGERSDAVRDAFVACGAVYFAAVAGCAAYMASCVKSVEVVAYDDLGTESIKRLVVEALPLTVAIDTLGNDFYHEGQKRYLESISSIVK